VNETLNIKMTKQKKVLVMDYLRGVPLSRAAEEMSRRGIKPDSPEAQLFGRKLLRSLTDVFGRCILETGFFHGEWLSKRKEWDELISIGNMFPFDDRRLCETHSR
jgi:hypothetical protein